MIPNNVVYAHVKVFSQASNGTQADLPFKGLSWQCVHDLSLHFTTLTFPWPKMSVCWTTCLPAYAAYNYFTSEKTCELTSDGNSA